MTITMAAIVLPAVFTGIQLSLKTASYAGNQRQAASLARSKMVEIIATGQTLRAHTEGDFGEQLPQYTWHADINSWEYDNSISQLDITVFWTGRNRTYHVILSTLVDLNVEEEEEEEDNVE